jgi:hypothetical protein
MTTQKWVIPPFSVWPCHLVYNVFSFRAKSSSFLIHPKNGDHTVSQNTGRTSTNIVAEPHKLELHFTNRLQKPKDVKEHSALAKKTKLYLLYNDLTPCTRDLHEKLSLNYSRYTPPFMEHKGSFLCSQVSATGQTM